MVTNVILSEVSKIKQNQYIYENNKIQSEACIKESYYNNFL